MNKFNLKVLLSLLLVNCANIVNAAIILQYHHVSNSTPASTSISPQQFKVHLHYLKDNGFTVVPLNEIVEAIKTQQVIKDKTVAITFDDAYLDILTQAKPILDSFNYPFTLFINPSIVSKKSTHYLTWQQLKAMADNGVIIANHGFDHHALARVPQGQTEQQWLQHYGKLLNKSEAIIKAKTGQSWHYFAYPYGEYSAKAKAWLTQLGFVGFSQQSGAVGLHSDLSALSRFPASQPYDQLSSLKTKLYSLPLNLTVVPPNKPLIYCYQQTTSISFKLDDNFIQQDDFHQKLLSCYITGIGKQHLVWQNQQHFTISFNQPLPIGRVRANCTVPSKSKVGRFYWHSHPWFILHENGDWYAL
ncbi:MAG: polysaccharide deacetylase [Gammaproteobacteria bacterium]|nr:MAG: polysaccharide deacetylase [Gammaproteobacteria bacterium]